MSSNDVLDAVDSIVGFSEIDDELKSLEDDDNDGADVSKDVGKKLEIVEDEPPAFVSDEDIVSVAPVATVFVFCSIDDAEIGVVIAVLSLELSEGPDGMDIGEEDEELCCCADDSDEPVPGLRFASVSAEEINVGSVLGSTVLLIVISVELVICVVDTEI